MLVMKETPLLFYFPTITCTQSKMLEGPFFPILKWQTHDQKINHNVKVNNPDWMADTLAKFTSIKSLFAPSEMAARLSYCSGSKSFKAAVRYSPAGVVLAFSEPDFTKATVPSVLSAANGEGITSIERPLL